MNWMMGAVLALGLGGCSWQDDVKVSGAGALVEQQHSLGREVTRVLAGVPANIHLVAGEARGIHIRGQGNLLPYLELTEKEDKLEIEVKEGYRLAPTEPLEITITLPELHELALAGIGNGELRDFKGDELVLSVAGTGDIVASGLELNRLEGNIAGLGSLDLGEGSVRVVALNIAGAGGVKGAGLASEEVEVSIAGSGEVEVRAQSRLKIEIAGSGSVSYWGDPELKSEIAGSGLVNRQGS
ncbi:GIN domain-containing protein [Aeromonas rivipollensis]|uniref:GIN domain-containing protein n=1 Tax=Aeromonas rivipollensis TaxID=948519 RepID=UPI003D061EB0